MNILLPTTTINHLKEKERKENLTGI